MLIQLLKRLKMVYLKYDSILTQIYRPLLVCISFFYFRPAISSCFRAKLSIDASVIENSRSNLTGWSLYDLYSSRLPQLSHSAKQSQIKVYP